MAGFDWQLQQVCGLLFSIMLLSRTDNRKCTADYVASTCFPHLVLLSWKTDNTRMIDMQRVGDSSLVPSFRLLTGNEWLTP